MGQRRFALLAGVLVALNLVLWLAPQGLALRTAVINKLFGPKLIRLEVVDRAPGGTTSDTKIDRGIIVSATSTLLTLSEADGRVQPIAVDDSTQVVFHGHYLLLAKLAPGWRVLVTWPANGTATLVKVESRHKVRVKTNSSSHPLPRPIFHLS